MENSKINLTNNDLIINYHQVTNKIDDQFVGLKIRNNRIDFYYPQTYNLDRTTLENERNDILAFLYTISIAKGYSSDDEKIESSHFKNKALPLPSFLWIIQDYLKSGLYINREKILKKNQRGKVDWKRTLDGEPIISKGNVIYNDLIVEIKNEFDNLLVEIHRYCVKKSLDVLGWLFGIKSSLFIHVTPVNDNLQNIYVDVLKKELNNIFDDYKKEKITHMLKIVEGLNDDLTTSEIVYGVDSYENIYEKIINSIFGNRDASNFYPSAYWYLKAKDYKEFKSSKLRPDTILVHNKTAYILDAKYYQYGFTAEIHHLPETTSIQKQITYGDYIKANMNEYDISEIRNAFILPFNKENNVFGYRKNLEYIGFSKTDYRKGEEHQIIHAFLIDLKSAIIAWNRSNNFDIVKELISEIEYEHKASTTRSKVMIN